MRDKPLLLVISGPSGSGKTTLCRQLQVRMEGLWHSVSATTRPRRRTETDGKDYIFVTPHEFDRMVSRGEMLEWTEIYGERYGTPRRPLEEHLAWGDDVLLDLDAAGRREVAEAFPGRVVSVFVLPPSVSELEERLARRGEEELETRLGAAGSEMDEKEEFDHVLVNDKLEHTLDELTELIRREKDDSVESL